MAILFFAPGRWYGANQLRNSGDKRREERLWSSPLRRESLAGTRTKVILTDKVFEENPVLSHDYLCQRLRMSLGAEPLFVPWDANEIYGHTDGVVRFTG